MKIIPYKTLGGKNLIKEYIDSLPTKEKAQAYQIILALTNDGYGALEFLNTRHIEGKLWEIKFPQHNRLFYIVVNEDNIFIPHVVRNKRIRLKSLKLLLQKTELRNLKWHLKRI